MIAALQRHLRRGPLTEPFEPYARALRDHWVRKRPILFHCRFGPWFSLMSTIEGFEPIYHRRSLEATALASCRGRVLDVGAAAGRNSLLLRDRGHEVVALDAEPTLVELMRCRGLHEVHLGDVFDFDRGAFDTILFMQMTIGIVGTLDRLRDLLARLKTRLTPRGQILLDSQSPHWWSRRWWTRRSDAYVGEIDVQLQYRWLLGRPFRWLSLDRGTLRVCAEAAGYDVELLAEGRMRDFLVRLTPRQPP